MAKVYLGADPEDPASSAAAEEWVSNLDRKLDTDLKPLNKTNYTSTSTLTARRRSNLDSGSALFYDSTKLSTSPPSLSLLALRTGGCDYDKIPRVSARISRVTNGNLGFAGAPTENGRMIPNRLKYLKK